MGRCPKPRDIFRKKKPESVEDRLTGCLGCCAGIKVRPELSVTKRVDYPMSIDKDTARKVAHLARIEVAEDQLDALAGELNGILGFMEQLNEVDVEGVEPMTSVTPMKLKRRVDAVTDGDQQAKILANAPDAREGFFAVPKVVE